MLTKKVPRGKSVYNRLCLEIFAKDLSNFLVIMLARKYDVRNSRRRELSGDEVLERGTVKRVVLQGQKHSASGSFHVQILKKLTS